MYKNYQSALRVLSKSDSVKLLIVAITQFGVAIFDLIGIILIGFLTTLSVYGIQSRDYDENTNKILSLLNLDKLSFQNQVATIGGIAVFVLIFKTIISTLITKKTILFISLKGAFISKKLLKNIFSSPINIINKFSTQQLVYSATSGVENLTTKLFGTSLAIFSDFALLIVIFLGLFMFNPITSLAIFTFFSLFATIINNITKHRAFSLGTQEAGLSVEINQDIYELINSYRELFVKNMKDPYLLNLVSKRFDLAKVNAKKLFLAPISKYIFEIALVMGCLLMCGVQFLLNDATAAITSLGIFLAATFRVAPAILRIQQGSMQIRNSLGTVETTIHLIDYFAQYENTAKNDNTEIKKIGRFNPEINVKNLEFKYNNEDKFTLNNLSFTIKPGSHVAIVGPSGSGKSTLLDLILGVLIPNSGDIRISGEIPIDAIKIWQGRIAYLPQSNFILNGNIAKNIALSNNISKSEEYSITEVLKIAQLDVFVHNLPQGIYTELGDKGFKLSGGQKQRLGIARALFTDPDLIIFDESTSSLDSNTENLISDALNKLNGKTILLVAHRLSSVKESDEIIYMENGSIKAIGSFDDVKRTVPNFDRQAKLLGL